MTIFKNTFVIFLIALGIMLTACKNNFEINKAGDLIFLEAKSKNEYPPTRIMTYDVGSGEKRMYMDFNSPVYNIKFDLKTNTLAVESVQDEIPYIHLINTDNKNTIRKIKNAKLGAIFNNMLIYEDYNYNKLTETKIVLMNVKENSTQSFILGANPVNYTISKDIDKLVYSRVINRCSHLYVYDIDKDIEKELIHNEKEFQPIWAVFISEDEIIYSNSVQDTHQLYLLNINDNNLKRIKLTNNIEPWINPDYSVQLKKIAFEVYRNKTIDIGIIDFDGSEKQIVLCEDNIDEYSPIWVK